MNANINANDLQNCEKQREYSGLETLFAWLCLLLGYLFCRSASPVHIAAVSLCVNALTVFVLLKKGVRLGLKPILLCLLSLVFSFSVVITPELTAAFSLVCALALYTLFIYTASGNGLRSVGRDLLPLNLLRALKGAGLSELAEYFRALLSRKNKSFKSVIYIALGLCAAVIPTMIVVSLLSYDGGFTKLLNDSFAFLKDFSLQSHIGSLLFGLVIAMYIFGLYSAGSGKYPEADIEKHTGRIERLRVVPAAAVAAAFVPLITVYVFFFISQWQYYLSAFSGVLPEGVINYAEYARSGFFELCTVSGINFALISLAALLLKREKALEKWILRVISIVISLMTLVLIGTAMAKMMLYIDRYGLTIKRVLSSWFMVLLFILFVFVIIRQLAPKFKLFTASGCVLLCMVLLLSVSNYKGVIADYNVDMYISGRTERIDVIVLCYMGEPSVPAIARLAEFYEQNEMTDTNNYVRLESELRARKKALEDKGAFEFSVPQYRAERAIRDYYGED